MNGVTVTTGVLSVCPVCPFLCGCLGLQVYIASRMPMLLSMCVGALTRISAPMCMSLCVCIYVYDCEGFVGYANVNAPDFTVCVYMYGCTVCAGRKWGLG